MPAMTSLPTPAPAVSPPPRAAHLYWQIARRTFARFATYRGATFAGVFTNTVFGFLRAYVLLALFEHRTEVGGFDAVDAVTYTFLTQGLFPTIGGVITLDLPQRIRTGQVVSDLYRPFDFQAYWFAQDAGRAAFHLMARGIPPLLVGALAFDIRTPTTPRGWAAFVAALAAAFLVGFGYRFLVSLIGFWLLDTRGAEQLLGVVMLFFSGFIVPVTFFPSWLASLAYALPFVAIMQLPVEVFLGHTPTLQEFAAVLGQQLVWAVALIALGRVVTARAFRKLVIQGG